MCIRTVKSVMDISYVSDNILVIAFILSGYKYSNIFIEDENHRLQDIVRYSMPYKAFVFPIT